MVAKACNFTFLPRTLQAMKIGVIAATDFEIAETKTHFKENQNLSNLHNISFFTSGVGSLLTAVNLMKCLYYSQFNLIVQAGIAGCYNNDEPLLQTVVIKNEVLGDLGVEEDNVFKNVFELNLASKDASPFLNGRLINPNLDKYNLLKLKEVNAITVNEITTRNKRINDLVRKYEPFSESMEGAALHAVCLVLKIPFIQIRTTSNYVGERNKQQWKMKESIHFLNDHLTRYLNLL